MAVINFQEAQDYLKFLPVLQNLPKRPFLLLYDPEAVFSYNNGSDKIRQQSRRKSVESGSWDGI